MPSLSRKRTSLQSVLLDLLMLPYYGLVHFIAASQVLLLSIVHVLFYIVSAPFKMIASFFSAKKPFLRRSTQEIIPLKPAQLEVTTPTHQSKSPTKNLTSCRGTSAQKPPINPTTPPRVTRSVTFASNSPELRTFTPQPSEAKTKKISKPHLFLQLSYCLHRLSQCYLSETTKGSLAISTPDKEAIKGRLVISTPDEEAMCEIVDTNDGKSYVRPIDTEKHGDVVLSKLVSTVLFTYISLLVVKRYNDSKPITKNKSNHTLFQTYIIALSSLFYASLSSKKPNKKRLSTLRETLCEAITAAQAEASDSSLRHWFKTLQTLHVPLTSSTPSDWLNGLLSNLSTPHGSWSFTRILESCLPPQLDNSPDDRKSYMDCLLIGKLIPDAKIAVTEGEETSLVSMLKSLLAVPHGINFFFPAPKVSQSNQNVDIDTAADNQMADIYHLDHLYAGRFSIAKKANIKAFDSGLETDSNASTSPPTSPKSPGSGSI